MEVSMYIQTAQIKNKNSFIDFPFDQGIGVQTRVAPCVIDHHDLKKSRYLAQM